MWPAEAEGIELALETIWLLCWPTYCEAVELLEDVCVR